MRKLLCAKCGVEINPLVLKEDAPYTCPSCRNLQHTEVFPAFFEDVEKGKNPEKAVVDEEARCFNHPDKVAVVPCSECGIYLCDLCDINADGVHFCSKCFKNNKNKLDAFVTRAVVYDEFLFNLSLVPVLFFPLTILTAPAVLICAFIFRSKLDDAPYKRSHWMYYTAITLATVQLIGWLAALVKWLAALVIFKG
jgi:hypothetical protein